MKFEGVLLQEMCGDLKAEKRKKTGGKTRKLRGKKAARATTLEERGLRKQSHWQTENPWSCQRRCQNVSTQKGLAFFSLGGFKACSVLLAI